MKCDFIACIYNNRNACCAISCIHIDGAGMCASCILVDIPEQALEEYKRAQAEALMISVDESDA